MNNYTQNTQINFNTKGNFMNICKKCSNEIALGYTMGCRNCGTKYCTVCANESLNICPICYYDLEPEV